MSRFCCCIASILNGEPLLGLTYVEVSGTIQFFHATGPSNMMNTHMILWRFRNWKFHVSSRRNWTIKTLPIKTNQIKKINNLVWQYQQLPPKFWQVLLNPTYFLPHRPDFRSISFLGMKTPERWCASHDPCCKVPSPQSPFGRVHARSGYHTKFCVHTSNGLTVRALTDRQRDTRKDRKKERRKHGINSITLTADTGSKNASSFEFLHRSQVWKKE